MKSGPIVPQVNTHQLRESDFQFYITLSRWQPQCHLSTSDSSKLYGAIQIPYYYYYYYSCKSAATW